MCSVNVGKATVFLTMMSSKKKAKFLEKTARENVQSMKMLLMRLIIIYALMTSHLSVIGSFYLKRQGKKLT